MVVPYPPHVGHGAVDMTWPRSERATRWMAPDPLHDAHVLGEVPGAQHVPAQVAHGSARLTETSRATPKIASSSVTSAWMRVSPPRWVRDAGPRRAPPPAEEGLEDVLEAEARGAAAAARVDPGVVPGALVRRGEHLVRLRHRLEPLLVAAVTRVGVMLAGEGAVRLLDLVLTRAARNAEHLVVVRHISTTRERYRATARTAAIVPG